MWYSGVSYTTNFFFFMRSRFLVVVCFVVGILGGSVLGQIATPSEMEKTQEVRDFLVSQIVDSLGGRDWVVSKEPLSYGEQLRNMAKARGVSLVIVDAPYPALSAEVQAQVQRLGEEAVEAARITPHYFAYHWMESAPDSARAHVAMLELPEIWRASRGEYVPSGLVFLGVPGEEEAKLKVVERFAEAQERWDEIGEFLLDSETGAATPQATALREELRLRVSRAANELGVLLESASLSGEAFEAYTRAYRMSSQNVVALMNKASLVKRGEQRGSQAELVAELNRHNAASVPEALRWACGVRGGTVAHAEDFVAMGWFWALGAVREGDGASMEEGLKVVPEHLRPQVLQRAAAAQDIKIGMVKQAKQIQEALQKPETRLVTALGMLREAILLKHGELVVSYWKGVVLGSGGTGTDVAMSVMSIQVAQGDIRGAIRTLEEALEENPEDWVVRRDLLNLQSLVRDRDALAKNVEYVKGNGGAPAGLSEFAQGLLWMVEEKVVEARGAFLKALSLQPEDVGLLDLVLKLDVQSGMGEPEETQKHAEAMLAKAPNHALANYVLGSMAFSEGKYEEARMYLQRSVETDAQEYSLNDYSCALTMLEQYDRAASVAEFALQKFPENAVLYDTYAEALIGMKQLDKAEEMVNKGKALLPKEVPPVVLAIVSLRKAHINWLRGDLDKARLYFREIDPHQEAFGVAELSLYQKLEKVFQKPEVAPAASTAPDADLPSNP